MKHIVHILFKKGGQVMRHLFKMIEEALEEYYKTFA